MKTKRKAFLLSAAMVVSSLLTPVYAESMSEKTPEDITSQLEHSSDQIESEDTLLDQHPLDLDQDDSGSFQSDPQTDQNEDDEQTVFSMAQSSSNAVKMFRVYNPNSGEHFYTSNTHELHVLTKAGWDFEGIGWTAPVSSKSPVYRLYNPNAGDHHFTMNSYERDRLKRVGWRYEGIGWYSSDSKEVPLYRQYNPNAKTGTHNYTSSKHENDSLVKAGWRAENIGWYGNNQFDWSGWYGAVNITKSGNDIRELKIEFKKDGSFLGYFQQIYNLYRGAKYLEIGVDQLSGKLKNIKEIEPGHITATSVSSKWTPIRSSQLAPNFSDIPSIVLFSDAYNLKPLIAANHTVHFYKEGFSLDKMDSEAREHLYNFEKPPVRNGRLSNDYVYLPDSEIELVLSYPIFMNP